MQWPAPGASSHQKRKVLAGFAALVVLVGAASVTVYLIWRTDAAKEKGTERRARLEQVMKKGETEAPARAEEFAEQERLSRDEQARRAEERSAISARRASGSGREPSRCSPVRCAARSR